MRRSLALAVLLTLLSGTGVACQSVSVVLDDALVPRGRLRLQADPIFTRWDSRFGRTASGQTGREDLGDDLTRASALALFPGGESLRAALEAMSGASGYTPALGETLGHVAKEITRVDLGGHIGVFDWLTVGVVVPWTRTRTDVDVLFRPDTTGGDLGLSPTETDASGVTSFLQALANADAAAQANATQVCASSPGSAACTSAQSLADRTSSFHGSAEAAYAATPFFPIEGSEVATSLEQATSSLDADLLAAGLPGIGVPMAFATAWVEESEFATLPTTASSGVLSAPLGDVRGLWHAGDTEVSATVRVLEGEVRDPAAAASRFSYRLIGTLLGRLPTGQAEDPDFLLDVGTGDGQSDVEARLQGQLTVGRRLELRGGARYGVQMPRSLVRRVAPPEVVLAPVSSRQLVEWNPGAYFGFEIAAAWRFSDELTLGGEYRAFRKYRDTYELTGTSVGASVDPTVLEVESGVTLHEVGGTLRYDTVASWLGGRAPRPLQLHARFSRAVAGGGGQTPVTTRLEFSIRLFRRIWGPD